MKKILFILCSFLTFLLFFLPSTASSKNVNYSIGEFENFKIKSNAISTTIDLSNYKLYSVNDYYDYTIYIWDVYEYGVNNLFEGKCIIKNTNYDYKISDPSNGNLNNYNTLEILIVENLKLEIIYVPLNDLDFQIITNHSIETQFENDDLLTNRLKKSLSFEYIYKSKLSNNQTKNIVSPNTLVSSLNSEIYCNSKNTVRYGAWLDYTNTDTCLQNLKNDSKFFIGQKYKNEQYTDCPLTYVIPREYFLKRGIFSYIGPEYGFYINTYQDEGDNNMSNFLVFDIKTKKKAYNQNGEVRVIPLLTGYTKYNRQKQIISYELDTSNLAITNINIAVALYNQTEKNIGDEGYIPEEDYGYAFKGYSIEAKTCSKNSSEYIPDLLLAKLTAIGLGFIPKVGPFIKVGVNTAILAIENYYKNETSTQYQSLAKINNSYVSNLTNLNASDSVYTMIHEYGNLLKGINASLTDSNEDNPLLYKTQSEDYFNIEYNLFQHSADICWDTTILTKLSLDIVEDNTYKNLFGTFGTVDFKDSVTGSWYDSFNEHPSIKETRMSLDNIYSIEYGIQSHQLLTFSPTYSGKYTIETFNTESDTIMELLENETLLSKNDDGGSYKNSKNNKLCSKITYTLDNSKKYTIKIYGYSNRGGYCNVMVRKQGGDLYDCVLNDFSIDSMEYNSEYLWQDFIPKKTGYYTFTTTANACSVLLSVYDCNYNRLANNYYSSYSGKTIINLYLKENQKYTIRSKIFNYMGRNYTFGVYATSSNLIINPENFASQEFRIEGLNSSIAFSIVLSETKSYKLGLQFAQAYNYLTINLYDEDLNLLGTKTILGTSYIDFTMNLTKNKCYYMHIKQIPNAPDNDYNFTQANIFVSW